MKTCSSCDLLMDDSQFYSNKRTSDGLHAYCKDCCKTKAARWRAENPDAPRRWAETRKQNNPDYYSRYRAANLDREKSRVSNWAKNNPEKRIANENRRRAAKRAGGSYSLDEWQALCSLYNDTCLACGVIPERLSPDHVVPLSKGGTNSIDNIQPLCLSCNLKKGSRIIDYRNER